MIGRVQPAAAVLDETGLAVSATDNAAEWNAHVASHRHATAYHQWGWRVSAATCALCDAAHGLLCSPPWRYSSPP